MKKRKRLFYLTLLIVVSMVLTTPGLILAQDIDIPGYTGYVNDFAGVLDPEVVSRLESLLSKTESETTAEIAVVTVENLQGWVIEDYAIELFEQWGIGKKDKDNGVLLLVAIEERELRLEIGYGLEGAITDVESKRIIDNIIVPRFKQGDYSRGVYEGAEAVASYIYQEAGVETDLPLQSRENSGSFPSYWLICCLPVFFIFAIIIFLVNLIRKRCPQCRGFFRLKTKQTVLKDATFTQEGQKKVERWCKVCDFKDEKLVKIPKKSRSSSTWMGGSGGSSGGSGGFGGFGGGSSGGGGASGKW
ncbi:MAG: TPM domain-containing protein [Actinomycetia bacterium]|nr:TPM domain-containing protein [Actinomycetes bacterium]